jgi:homoserine dehydrogenase
VHPCLLAGDHPLAAVGGAFNAVMLQGRSIRELILEGPGAGGEETATAVIGDLVAVIGTQGTGFLQHDVHYRDVGRFAPERLESPCYLRFTVDDTPGVLAQVAQQLADQAVSVAQVVQHAAEDGVHIVILTHRAPEGAVRAAASGVAAKSFSRQQPVVLPVLER